MEACPVLSDPGPTIISKLIMERVNFIKSVLGASAFVGISLAACNEKESLQSLIDNTKRKVTGKMFNFSCAKIEKVKVGIIG